MVCVLPSWFRAVSRMTARMGSRSLMASSRDLMIIDAMPSPRPKPSARLSNEKHLPLGPSNLVQAVIVRRVGIVQRIGSIYPRFDIEINISGFNIKFAPPTIAVLDSPARTL